MKSRILGFLAIGFLMMSVRAQAIEHHLGTWTGVTLQGLFNPNWGWSFENQLRLHEGWEYRGGSPNSLETRANRMLIRPALRWLPRGDASLQFAVGWGWTPNLSPERNENRVWQQVLFQGGNPRESLGWVSRFRLEQRHIEYTSGLEHRARYLGRLSRFFSHDGIFGITSWAEVFWNLNTKTGGPVRGLDQTRLFVGPMVAISPTTRWEMGYLNVYYPKGAARDSLISHVLGTFVQFDLP